MAQWRILDDEQEAPKPWRLLPPEGQPLPRLPLSEALGPGGQQKRSELYELHRQNTFRNTDTRARDRDARRATLTNALGGQFDPESTFGSGVGDFFSMADVARSGTPQDIQAKFSAKFPQGDMRVIQHDNDPVYVGRKSPDDPYREFGAGAQVAEAMVNEPMVLGTAAALAAPSLPAAAGLTALGVGAGSLAKYGIEKARGYDSRTTGEAAAGAAGEGVLAGVFQGAAGLAGRTIGAKFPSARSARMDAAARAADEEGFAPLVWGQTSESPVVTGTFRQVGATSPTPQRVVGDQQASMLAAAQRQVEKGAALDGMSDDALRQVVDAQTAELGTMLTPGQPMRQTAGEAIQKGIKTYKEATSRLGARFYNKAAEASEGVRFNITPAKQDATRIMRGIKGQGESGEAVQVAGTPKGEFADALQSIIDLQSPVADYRNKTAFEIVKSARSRFFDLKFSDDPMVAREAGIMWNRLRGAMDNPVEATTKRGTPSVRGAKRNEDFVAAHQKARDFWRVREENLEKSYVANALKSDTPETLAARYYQPGNTTALKTLEDIMPRRQWDSFRRGFQLDLTNAANPQASLARIRNFKATDPDGLRLLLNGQEEKQVTAYLNRAAQFDKSPVNRSLQRNMTQAERALEIMRKGTAADVADVVRLSGGKNTPQAESLKSAVYQDIIDKATDITPDGQRILDPQKVLNTTLEWQRGGKLNALFDDTDWKRILNFQAYAAPLSESADIGGGMMAGAARQQMIQGVTSTLYGDATKLLRPLRTIYANNLTAAMLSRPTTADIPRKALARGIQGVTAGLVQFEREMSKRERMNYDKRPAGR